MSSQALSSCTDIAACQASFVLHELHTLCIGVFRERHAGSLCSPSSLCSAQQTGLVSLGWLRGLAALCLPARGPPCLFPLAIRASPAL